MDVTLTEVNRNSSWQHQLTITPPHWENAIYISLFIVLNIWIILSNSTLCFIIIRSKLLCEAHKLIRISLASLDILMSISGSIIPFWVLFRNNDVNMVACGILSFVGVSVAFSVIYMTTLLSVERFIYIAHPLKYQRYMSVGRTVIYITTAVAAPMIYTISVRSLNNVIFQNSIMICGPDEGTGLKILSIFIIPSAVTSAVILILMKRLQHSKNAGCRLVISQSNIVKNVRMILLMSGTLWMTYLPAYLVRVILLNIYSLEEINSRENMVPFTISRLSAMLLTLISSSINPAVTFYIEKNLRCFFQKLLGKKVDYPWQNDIKKVSTKTCVTIA